MNTRLQQFLDLENLTPARLADIIGVQRSGLSHILSGRNKPSFDFIKRILVKFPRINAEWLITGKGKPYKDFEPTPTPISAHQNSGGNFSDNRNFPEKGNFSGRGNFSSGQNFALQENFDDNENFSDSRDFDERENFSSGRKTQTPTGFGSEGLLEFDENFENSSAQTEFFTESEYTQHQGNTTQSTDNKSITHKNEPQYPSENRVNGVKPGGSVQKRSVKRVIIFYSDGSFEELFPRIR